MALSPSSIEQTLAHCISTLVENGPSRPKATSRQSVSVTAAVLQALERFFDEEYWKGVWIIQEIMVVSKVRILYGELDFPWDDVASVLLVLSIQQTSGRAIF